MGFKGDFKIEQLSSNRLRIRDRHTHERIGDICLDDYIGKDKKRGSH